VKGLSVYVDTCVRVDLHVLLNVFTLSDAVDQTVSISVA